MAILILIFAFLSTYSIFYLREPIQEDSLRTSWLKTCISYGILISILTEILSLNKALNYVSVTLFWLVVAIINSIIIFCLFYYKLFPWPRYNQLKFNFRDLDEASQVSLGAVLLVLVITLVTSLIAAPNNWDSMTYHLPRVMHWIQNHSVNQYPTNNLRQISFAPGSGYIIMQFQILYGGDRFANCVQWLALLGGIIGTSLITRILIRKKDQLVSALVCVSIPMAIMQASTTQNDLLTAFWLVCYTYFIFRHDRYSTIDLFWIAASFSLAILTKPTAIIFGMPFSLVVGYRIVKFQLKHDQQSYFWTWTKGILTLIILGFTSFSLSLPSYWRNYHTFGNFMGIDTGTKAEAFGVFPLISTFLKNILINFPFSFLRGLIRSIHDHILFLSIDEPKINFAGINILEESLIKLLSPHEDFVGSPIHYLLFCLGFTAILVSYFKIRINQHKQNLDIQKSRIDRLLLIGLCVIVDFILFSMLLKWQIWNNRLLLPLVILGTPIMTYYIRNILDSKCQKFIALFLAFIAIVYSLIPMRHPLLSLPIISEAQLKEQSGSIVLIDRKDIYFSGARKELKVPYQEAVKTIAQNHCYSIGLALGGDDWEYPLWILLGNNLRKPFQIKHINVQNQSQKLESEFADSRICAVISTIATYDIQDLNYSKQWHKLIISEKLPENYLTVYLAK